MKQDKYVILCDRCNLKFSKDADSIGFLDFTCSECNKSDRSFVIDYIPGDEDFYTREIVRGKGGSLHS